MTSSRCEFRNVTHDEEWVVGFPEHPVLCHRVLHLALLDDDLLLEDLDGVQFGSGLFAAKDHLAIGTTSKDFQELEVF